MKKIVLAVFILLLIPGLVYAGTSIGSVVSKEMGNATQSMKSYDTNFDGKKDRFDYYERQNLVTITYDYDEDGKIDEKDIVKDNIVIERDIQKDGKTIFVVKMDSLTDSVTPAPDRK